MKKVKRETRKEVEWESEEIKCGEKIEWEVEQRN